MYLYFLFTISTYAFRLHNDIFLWPVNIYFIATGVKKVFIRFVTYRSISLFLNLYILVNYEMIGVLLVIIKYSYDYDSKTFLI